MKATSFKNARHPYISLTKTMCAPGTSEIEQSDDYGLKLYDSDDFFKKLFSDFEKDQESSAQQIWKRVLSRCGTDCDLPRVTQVVDYGCGEGTFSKYLAGFAAKDGRDIDFWGIDSSSTAILQANSKAAETCPRLRFSHCNPCPNHALGELFEDKAAWKTTALLVMSHTWFHFDQDCLIRTILELRPAVLLVDVYSTWDYVINQIKQGKRCHLEHGRPPEDGKTFWLKTEKMDDGRVRRGVWKQPESGDGEWLFKTVQTPYTTHELFGGVMDAPSDVGAEIAVDDKSTYGEKNNDMDIRVLEEGRTNGMFTCKKGNDKDIRYVRQMSIHHQSGWGAMDCHVLVCRDPLAAILNQAFFQVMESSIKTSVSLSSNRTLKMISLFDDPKPESDIVTGSREALVLLAFDPCLVFARIVPLFPGMDKVTISNHPLLIEHPSRDQTHYPSANGVFQTCFARSSSVQAFATHWASDYQLTEVDRAIENLELEVLGLNSSDIPNSHGTPGLKQKRGCWGNEQAYPSYFMLPTYFGSMPLFCLALKFPKPFDPTTTSFDVFYSTLKSLHDDILVLLTDDVVRLTIVRSWIQACLEADWSAFPEHGGVDSKLTIMEQYLFGCEKKEAAGDQPLDYILDESTVRTGGVLGREWKSWVLGLPSYPIKKMASVQAMNKRLWAIWQEERKIAYMDAALRISHWFQEGGFFENSGEENPHDYWHCKLHLKCLKNMFRLLGYQVTGYSDLDDQWLKDAVVWLAETPNADLYFGKRTAKHYLFSWMCEQLRKIVNAKDSCEAKHNCLPQNIPGCPRNLGPFQALKSVFCKTLANTGDKVRFSLHRLYHMLDAARLVKGIYQGAICPNTIESLNDKYDLPQSFDAKFWSDEDPTSLLSEVVHVFAAMHAENGSALGMVCITQAEPLGDQSQVAIRIEINLELRNNRGGDESRRLLELVRMLEEKGVAVTCIHNVQIVTAFCMNKNGNLIQPKT